MTFVMSMIINKLASGVKMPYNVVKGSFVQRQSKSGNLADLLYKNVQNHLIDDYSKIDYLSLQKYIQNILPDKGVKIIVTTSLLEAGANVSNLYTCVDTGIRQ